MKRLVFLAPALLIALLIPVTSPASDLYWWDKTEDGEITEKDYDVDFKDNPAKSLGEKQIYDNGTSPEAAAIQDEPPELATPAPVRSVTPRITPRTTPADVRSGRELPSSSRNIRRATPSTTGRAPAVNSRKPSESSAPPPATKKKFGWGQKKPIEAKPNPVTTNIKPPEPEPKAKPKLKWGRKAGPADGAGGPAGGPGIR